MKAKYQFKYQNPQIQLNLFTFNFENSSETWNTYKYVVQRHETPGSKKFNLAKQVCRIGEKRPLYKIVRFMRKWALICAKKRALILCQFGRRRCLVHNRLTSLSFWQTGPCYPSVLQWTTTVPFIQIPQSI